MLSGQAEALAIEDGAGRIPARKSTIARESRGQAAARSGRRASTQLERIRAALADEILAGKVGADQTATTIFIRIGSVVLFPSGGAKVNDSFAPIAKKIAPSLDKEPGAIRVDGYTDSDPIKTVAFPSNFELSRGAGQVGRGAAQGATSRNPERVDGDGKGRPTIRSRRTTPKRTKSKNRRVEISIPRAD